jgi:ankyrin repeat protein
LAGSGGVPVIDAVKQGNLPAVKALLQKRADVNAPEGDGATALHWAAYRNDADMVDLLIKSGAKVNQANDLKITPLYLASAGGNAAIVEKLLRAGADPEAASEAGVTPLMEAANSGNAAAVNALLAHEANVNVHENDRQQTPLMWAAAESHPEIVKLLLDHHADFRARTRVRNLTVMLDQGSRGVKTSRENGTQLDFGGYTAVFFAAQAGDAESVKLLLAAGSPVNDTAGDGNTALVLAAFNGRGSVRRRQYRIGAGRLQRPGIRHSGFVRSRCES